MRLTVRSRMINNNEKGFTLIELMIALAILGMAIGAIYSFLSFTQKSYAYADAQSEVSQEATLFFSQIEKDIRNAAEPNKTSKAIHIDDGQQIDIYQFNNGEYHRISYRRNPDNGMILERGFISTDTQDTDLNPDYGTIDNWKTVVANLMPGTAEIFSDRNPDDTISSRRLIDINLSLKHPQMMTAMNMQSSVMNRSGRSTASIETGGGSYSAYIPVTGIEFVTVPETFPKAGGNGATIIAKVIPANATNKNLVWSQQIFSVLWLSFPEYSLTYDDGTGSTLESLVEGVSDKLGYWDMITTRSGTAALINVKYYETLDLPEWLLDLFGALAPDPRTTNIRVTSPDGPAATLEIKQNRDQ